jgi:hypothetical protein
MMRNVKSATKMETCRISLGWFGDSAAFKPLNAGARA